MSGRAGGRSPIERRTTPHPTAKAFIDDCRQMAHADLEGCECAHARGAGYVNMTNCAGRSRSQRRALLFAPQSRSPNLTFC